MPARPFPLADTFTTGLLHALPAALLTGLIVLVGFLGRRFLANLDTQAKALTAIATAQAVAVETTTNTARLAKDTAQAVSELQRQVAVLGDWRTTHEEWAQDTRDQMKQDLRTLGLGRRG